MNQPIIRIHLHPALWDLPRVNIAWFAVARGATTINTPVLPIETGSLPQVPTSASVFVAPARHRPSTNKTTNERIRRDLLVVKTKTSEFFKNSEVFLLQNPHHLGAVFVRVPDTFLCSSIYARNKAFILV